MVEWKSRIPALSGNEQVDMRRVLDYTLQLSEEMRYHLNNLGVDNFNTADWAAYEDGLLKLSAERMEIAVGALELKIQDDLEGLGKKYLDLEANVDGFKIEIGESLDSVYEEIDGVTRELLTEIETTAEGIRVTVSEESTALYEEIDAVIRELMTEIDVSAEGIRSEVSATYLTKTSASDTYVTKSTFNQTANEVSAIVTAIGDDGEVTAASIVAAINAAGSQVVISADHIDLDGIATFTNISESGGQTVIDGAYILSEGEHTWDYIAIDGGFVELGHNGYLGQYDEGIVRMGAGRLRLEGDTDVIIAGKGATDGAVYIYCYRNADPDGAGFGWRFNANSIDHRPIGSDTWTPVVEV